jgi:hypothetical protein
MINEGRCILDSLRLPVYEHYPLATVLVRDRLLEAKRKYQDGLSLAARDDHKADAERGLLLYAWNCWMKKVIQNAAMCI